LCEHIRFLGKQDAIEELLSLSDLFLLPSQNESFGLAALEAMACEVPVISSNIGGIPEVNEDGITGFCHDVGDIDSMAHSAINLLSDETLLNRFRANALKKAKEFHIDKILPHYESYYLQVIEASKVAVNA
jgi:glycosyltransferase involved in cell wall biosynthesis